MQNNSRSVSTRVAEPEDARAIARVHMAAMQGHLLTLLGESVAQPFYRTLLTQPLLFGYIAEDESGAALGFVVGGQSAPLDAWRESFRRSHRGAVIRAVPRAILRPDAPRVLAVKARHWIRARLRPVRTDSDPEDLRLLSIAVIPEAHGMGVGRALVERFEGRGREMGRSSYGLSVYAGNDEAVSFYRRGGFQVERPGPITYFRRTLD